MWSDWACCGGVSGSESKSGYVQWKRIIIWSGENAKSLCIAAATVSAQLAFDCLQTVPNKPDPAVAMVKSLKAFVQWQSTLAFLKDPPSSYMLPATDIEGGLDNISSTVVAGGFKSEYDFQLSVIKLIISAHDGHFAYRPDVFKAFAFRNTLASDIVSVSKDGKAVPKLYHLGGLFGILLNRLID